MSIKQIKEKLGEIKIIIKKIDIIYKIILGIVIVILGSYLFLTGHLNIPETIRKRFDFFVTKIPLSDNYYLKV